MKNSIVLLFTLFAFSAFSQEKKINLKNQIVEVSCGQCQFEITEKLGCDLAVRIDGKSYFVEGTKINDHGVAHAHNGFCQTIRKAEVSGEISDAKFKITHFVLLPKE